MESALVRSSAALVAVIALVGCEQVLGLEPWPDAGATTTQSDVPSDVDDPTGAGGAAPSTGSQGGAGGASCVPDVTVKGACKDCVKNGDETDVDCGGAVCKTCPRGAVCLVGEDCENGACLEGLCH